MTIDYAVEFLDREKNTSILNMRQLLIKVLYLEIGEDVYPMQYIIKKKSYNGSSRLFCFFCNALYLLKGVYKNDLESFKDFFENHISVDIAVKIIGKENIGKSEVLDIVNYLITNIDLYGNSNFTKCLNDLIKLSSSFFEEEFEMNVIY